MDNYDLFSASRQLGEFINELSTWYVRRSRDRFKGDDVVDKQQAINTLGWSLLTLAKVMAPFVPFIAEHLYQNLTTDKAGSVHMQTWPVVSGEIDEFLLADMNKVRDVVQLGLAKRDELGIKVRQPLAKIIIKENSGLVNKTSFHDIIKDELNIKQIEFETAEILVVELDATIDEDLQKEGIVRELVRQVNTLRKSAKLTINDVVNVIYQSGDELIQKAITENQEQLLKQTSSQAWLLGEAPESLARQTCKVNEQEVNLAIIKL